MKHFAKFTFAIAMILIAAMPVFGHGVVIDRDRDPETGEITITAAFDSGEIMDEAQVAIFAPDDLVNPWLTGTTDANGVFTFLPDYSIEGNWDIQVRKAGHGGLVNMQLDSSMTPAADSGDGADTAQDEITISGGTTIVIEGDARFEVTGDVVITAPNAAQSSAAAPPDPLGNGFTPAQIAIMSASVIWGLIGTALYFSRRKKPVEIE